jgi:hypothetical protein
MVTFLGKSMKIIKKLFLLFKNMLFVNWFIQAYYHSKLMFSFFILFIFFQIYFTFKGVEMYPFLLYGMYSSPVYIKDSIDFQHLNKYNDKITIQKSEYIIKVLNTHNYYMSENNDPNERIIQKYVHHNALINKLNRCIVNRKASNKIFEKWMLSITGYNKMPIIKTKRISKTDLAHESKSKK